ncbi:Uma2 family endonuclease [Dyadobacter chenwenxiniae]|uniref:Uma2 family endonuclease n=1 Tax=Dyadobacter chenwenxiniae TaxID=2906456 RepID=A0A9X1PPH7_9BACT|nr:Uma2 family endonuclease [Dyadobacter chenwenxiniae]MCF0064130.1 Uma2 family endonuclease [Dyadobacter chenwenxiniae]UON82856.1 Uma2 family endonuclease [Dyadobacter chenwenxiniae]
MDMPMPVTMKMGDLMSEEEFFQFCQMNDTLEFERDSQGNIILMSPTGSFTGKFNVRFIAHLSQWSEAAQLGEVFDSSTGFTLPNGAVRSPDASFVTSEKWDALSEDQQETFAPICPDFVIEIRSKSDELKYLLDKMKEYIANGCKLGWLIDRLENKVHIYKAGQSVVIHDSLDVILSGEEILPGFSLNPGSLLK